MLSANNTGRTALASRLQTRQVCRELGKRNDTEECCKDSNIFAKCHPTYRKSGLILFIFKLNSCYNDEQRTFITDAE